MKATCCLGQKTAFNQTCPRNDHNDWLTHISCHFTLMGHWKCKRCRILGWLCKTIAKVPKLGCRTNDTQIMKKKQQAGYWQIRCIPWKTEGPNKLNLPLLLYKMEKYMGEKNNPPFCMTYFQVIPIFMCIQRSISMKWRVRDNSSSPPKVRLNSFPIKFKPY